MESFENVSLSLKANLDAHNCSRQSISNATIKIKQFDWSTWYKSDIHLLSLNNETFIYLWPTHISK